MTGLYFVTLASITALKSLWLIASPDGLWNRQRGL